MLRFSSEIFIIGVNPYVPVPDDTVQSLFTEAKKSSGPIPVRGSINGRSYIQTVVFEEIPDGFSLALGILYNGKLYYVNSTGGSKKSAEAKAYASILEQIKSDKPEQVGEDVATGHFVIRGKDEEFVNYKGLLQGVMHDLGFKYPKYMTVPSGTKQQRTFTSVARVEHEGTQIVSDPYTSISKKEAEQHAAEEIYRKILAKGDSDEMRRTVEVKGINYTGVLLEFCQKNNLPEPQYVFNKVGPDEQPLFIGMATIKLPNGKIIDLAGNGSSEKEARREASRQALAWLAENRSS